MNQIERKMKNANSNHDLFTHQYRARILFSRPKLNCIILIIKNKEQMLRLLGGGKFWNYNLSMLHVHSYVW